MHDNRIFNMNGKGDQMLLRALELAFEQAGSNCRAWVSKTDHGLVLLSHGVGSGSFPCGRDGLTAQQIFPMVVVWLVSDDAENVTLTGWDVPVDHDGSNERGWRVYCEDWGHVGDVRGAICAIKPAYLWFGK